MIIQILLLAGLAFIVWYFVRERDSMPMRAGKRLLFLLFIIVSALSVLLPNELNVIAHFVGISRGADLLLYGLIVAFIFTVLNVYLKFSDAQRKISVLTREVTLLKKQLETLSGQKRK